MAERAKTLLIVDDDASVVSWLEDELQQAGYAVSGATSGAAALERLDKQSFDLVISDVEMPGMRGPELLAAIHQRRPSQLVLLITAFGTIELAVECVRAGACDFIAKPFPIEALVHAVERALRERQMRRQIVRLRGMLASGNATGELVARSEAMQQVLSFATRAASLDAPVLITGESGVGKTALARLIHERGPRSKGQFLELNCAALPSPLVEAELFGVRRGAYTDAKESRAGLFEQAHGGTLFLDEIGELGLDVQPKLLQALETGRVRPIGGGKEVSFSARIIAATNLSLEHALKERRFRADLYHRINVLRIEIPPLRERQADVEALVELFLHRASERVGRAPVAIAESTLRWILAQPWPGNARELSNAIERAVALSDHDTLLREDFEQPTAEQGASPDDASLESMTLKELERQHLKRVLKKTGGNKTLAAQILGLDRRTVYRKVAELGLDGPEE
ncbi:MAG TPA: sigma-54 dependent transcriptional regulator [Polyangiales bacterium]|nr:sigma-54 dependent transcriptional regulator [Polyangiales bacterium]